MVRGGTVLDGTGAEPVEAGVAVAGGRIVAFGLRGRGVLAPGVRADLNVLGPAALTLERLEMVHDLPAGGRRLLQRARGYAATGALPRRLVRNTVKV